MIGLKTSYIIQIQQTTAVSSLCSQTPLRVHLQWGAVLLQILNSGNGSFLTSVSVRVTLAHPQELSSHMRMKLLPPHQDQGVTTTDVTCSSAGMTGSSRGAASSSSCVADTACTSPSSTPSTSTFPALSVLVDEGTANLLNSYFIQPIRFQQDVSHPDLY